MLASTGQMPIALKPLMAVVILFAFKYGLSKSDAI
jgi:hypothetical protein